MVLPLHDFFSLCLFSLWTTSFSCRLFFHEHPQCHSAFGDCSFGALMWSRNIGRAGRGKGTLQISQLMYRSCRQTARKGCGRAGIMNTKQYSERKGGEESSCIAALFCQWNYINAPASEGALQSLAGFQPFHSLISLMHWTNFRITKQAMGSVIPLTYFLGSCNSPIDHTHRATLARTSSNFPLVQKRVTLTERWSYDTKRQIFLFEKGMDGGQWGKKSNNLAVPFPAVQKGRR